MSENMFLEDKLKLKELVDVFQLWQIKKMWKVK